MLGSPAAGGMRGSSSGNGVDRQRSPPWRPSACVEMRCFAVLRSMRWIFDGVKKAPQPGELAIGRLGARWRRRQQRGGQAEQQKAAERARGAETRQRARLEMD